MFMHMKAGHCLNIQNQKEKLFVQLTLSGKNIDFQKDRKSQNS